MKTRKEMKKFVQSLYTVALAALVFASCAKEPFDGKSGVSAAGSEVQFGSNIVNPTPAAPTRVTDNGWSASDMVGIYMKDAGVELNAANAGVPIRPIYENGENQQYRVNTTTSKLIPFNKDQTMYYPLDEEHLVDFVAYYPYVASEDMLFTPVEDGDDIPLYQFEVSTTDNTPVLYSKIEAVAPTTELQSFVFQHKMARIRLNITLGEGIWHQDFTVGNNANGIINDTYNYTASDFDVSMINANIGGPFSLITGRFPDNGLNNAVERGITRGDIPFFTRTDLDGVRFDSLLCIPNTGNIEGRRIELSLIERIPISDVQDNATVLLGYERGTSVIAKFKHEIPLAQRYELGKEYTYNITITRNGLDVTMEEVAEWKPGEEAVGEQVSLSDRMLRPALSQPNSYIMATDAIAPLMIPVKKAFAVWALEERHKAYGLPGEDDYTAEIVWADNADLATGLTVTLESDPLSSNLSDAMIKVEPIGGGMPSGNALIALTHYYSGEIVWSWHVWITDIDTETDVYTYNNGRQEYTFMNCNLGAIVADKDDAGSKGLLYQWGRKDPFVGSVNWTNNTPTTYTASGGSLSFSSWNPSNDGDPYAVSTMLPFAIATSTEGQPWVADLKADDWGMRGAKSMFDPCPEGWRVPDFSLNSSQSLSPWYKSGGIFNNLSTWGLSAGGFTYGWDFNGAGYEHGWYPAAGYIDNNAQRVKAGATGAYWTAKRDNAGAHYFTFVNNEVHADIAEPTMGKAMSVRCVKVAQ